MIDQKNLRFFVGICMTIALLTGCATVSISAPSTTAPTTIPSTTNSATTTIPKQPTTAPTQPPTEPSTPTEPTTPTQPEPAPFPKDLENNVYLSMMGTGFCEEMTGTMMVTIIFLSDSISSWDSASIAAAKEHFDQDLPKLESNAEIYGQQLDVQITYLESKILQAQDKADTSLFWAKSALSKHGLSKGLTDAAFLENHYNADSAPVVFVLHREGRAYASTTTGQEDTFEYVVMYSSALTSIRHELCHLHGAMDLYFPQETVDAANQHLSDSIMLESINGAVDALTAYTIGWTDTLLPNAEAFLRATNHITQEYLNQTNQENMMTGYGTKRFDGCTYTGYLLAGMPHGEGTCTWDVGVVYTGSWVNGLRSGYGEQTEPSGTVYKGQWVNDVIQGEGTLYYSDGKQVYTGQFQNGRPHGYGTHTFANGDVYSGQWSNGIINGEGTFTWTTGDVYTGSWVNGKRTGYGVLTYANGSRYEGEFKNDKRHGQGTYYDVNGNVTEGVWNNDVLVKKN